MKTFKDTKNRTWEVVINYGSIKRIKDLLGVNILDLIYLDDETNLDVSLLNKYAEDIILLIDTLYCICKPQADALGISDVEFGESFSGEEAGKALNALVEETINFFQEPKRTLLTKIYTKVNNKETEIQQKAMEVLESQEFENKLDSLLSKLNN